MGWPLHYSVDTSALLDGWRRYYSPDVFPAVWNKLDLLIQDARLIASMEVYRELERKDDDVYAWLKDRRSMFIEIDPETQTRVTAILRSHPDLVDQRRGRSGADAFVIALAQIRHAAVVTAERRSNSPRKPRIPDVCTALGVPCVSLLELFREQGWVFS